MFCLNPLFFNQVPLTLRFGNNFYFHFCNILAKKKPEEGRVSNVVLQKVCYFTSTDCYPGQTNKLVKAKPDLSTTEERGKKGKKQNKRKPKQTKTPKATTTAKCLAKFTTLMIPKTFETFKAHTWNWVMIWEVFFKSSRKARTSCFLRSIYEICLI